MKKHLVISYLLTVASLVSCGEDSEIRQGPLPTRPRYQRQSVHASVYTIIGTWKYFKESSGENVSSKIIVEWEFCLDKTATETLIVEVNGIEMKRSTLRFLYIYDQRSKILFSSLDKGKSFEYEVSVKGNQMSLGNKEDGYFELTREI